MTKKSVFLAFAAMHPVHGGFSGGYHRLVPAVADALIADCGGVEKPLRKQKPALPADHDFGDEVLNAIHRLDRADKDLFTNAGKPDAGALSRILGRTVSAADRDAVWATYEAAVAAALAQ